MNLLEWSLVWKRAASLAEAPVGTDPCFTHLLFTLIFSRYFFKTCTCGHPTNPMLLFHSSFRKENKLQEGFLQKKIAWVELWSGRFSPLLTLSMVLQRKQGFSLMSLSQVKLKKGHVILEVLCLGESFSGTDIEIERGFGKPDKSYKTEFPSSRIIFCTFITPSVPCTLNLLAFSLLGSFNSQEKLYS